MKKRVEGALRALVVVLLCLASLMTVTLGYYQVDTARRGSVTLVYEYNAAPLEGMELRLYRVAEVSESARFTLTENFRASGVNLDAAESQWPSLAATLAAYAQKQEDAAFQPEFQGKTNEEGRIDAQELALGLYLVMGNPLHIGRATYSPTPFLLTVPQLNEEGDNWAYEVKETVAQKVSYGYDTPSSRKVTVTVEKVWAGDAEEARPASIDVTLLRDGKAYETVTLDASHGWKHTWRNLSSKAEWTLTEQVPKNYTVLVEKNQSGSQVRFVVTNTFSTPEVTPTPSPEPSVPPTSTPGPSPAPSPVTTPEPTVEPSLPPVTPQPDEVPAPTPTPVGDYLPQTGLVWWPIWVLAGVGLALSLSFFATGRKRK